STALAGAVALAMPVMLVHTQTASPQARAQRRATRAAPAAPALKRTIPYVDAKPILDALRADLLPAELIAKEPTARQSAWPGWVAGRDAQIRSRVVRGDEESIVNFLMFGTS